MVAKTDEVVDRKQAIKNVGVGLIATLIISYLSARELRIRSTSCTDMHHIASLQVA